ncbi:MAG: hypothetical protein GPJ52_12710 [Candidatus Heimdallarchaeota archaeon]|nr:hypothetical protein [Candidatus Heimdallarchaeota archaeon]
MKRLPVDQGMLYYLIKDKRPELAEHIKKTGSIDTVIIGLGRQGLKHAGLMKDFGTKITAGISKGRGGTRIHEVIPVYESITDCVKEHPNIAIASIWRHYSGVKDVAIEVIESGIPIVVLISEFIPLKDVRDIIVAAKKHKTILFGGNTPGIIFPPEGVKVGMLPDIFYPEEKNSEEFGPKGVTIVSRSGAILYHMSDALASVGIAQNAVLGIGGDGAIGTRFLDIVPVVQQYENTDLIVIAGEIGGCQEEILAEDIAKHPEKYPKPIVALISGSNAPEGKTMGHAGAIVTPGQEYGTFKSKKAAFEKAGIPVVNGQHDLIKEVQVKLKNKQYFPVKSYREKLRKNWEEPPKKPEWATLITKIEPNNIIISGYPLQDIVKDKTLLETTYLLIKGKFPSSKETQSMEKIALEAVKIPTPKASIFKGEDIAKTLGRFLVSDEKLAEYSKKGIKASLDMAVFGLGRIARYLSAILKTEKIIEDIIDDATFTDVIYQILTGEKTTNKKKAELLEAMIVASVDHGVTPPSTQSTLIAASVRAPLEVALAQGVGAITDVHGGAGTKAVHFFKKCVEIAKEKQIDLSTATYEVITEYVKDGKRVQGLGHRIHTKDPRRDILWIKAENAGIASDSVKISKELTEIFKQARGIDLPINVDGVIGAIIADIGLNPILAKAVFIFGRIAGLSAHYFEELISQPQMRRINFSEVVYKGKKIAK